MEIVAVTLTGLCLLASYFALFADLQEEKVQAHFSRCQEVIMKHQCVQLQLVRLLVEGQTLSYLHDHH